MYKNLTEEISRIKSLIYENKLNEVTVSTNCQENPTNCISFRYITNTNKTTDFYNYNRLKNLKYKTSGGTKTFDVGEWFLIQDCVGNISSHLTKAKEGSGLNFTFEAEYENVARMCGDLLSLSKGIDSYGSSKFKSEIEGEMSDDDIYEFFTQYIETKPYAILKKEDEYINGLEQFKNIDLKKGYKFKKLTDLKKFIKAVTGKEDLIKKSKEGQTTIKYNNGDDNNNSEGGGARKRRTN